MVPLKKCEWQASCLQFRTTQQDLPFTFNQMYIPSHSDVLQLINKSHSTYKILLKLCTFTSVVSGSLSTGHGAS